MKLLNMRKKALFLFTIVIVLIAALEMFLRNKYGFGNPPLYVESPSYGYYIQAPNQNIFRYGNSIITNEYSMRSLPLRKEDSIRVLMLGDSVINGGAPTDQKQLASTNLEKQLSLNLKKSIRVLNVSGGGWSPDNAAGYIKERGSFGAKIFVLVFSSHDAFTRIGAEQRVVGVDVNFPNKNPPFALYEVVERYLIPRIKNILKIDTPNYELQQNNNNRISSELNSGWKYLEDYANKNHIKIFVVVHPTTKEIKAGNYEPGGQLIIKHLNATKTPYLLELDNNLLSASFYRDVIHYNANGQKLLYSEIYPVLRAYLENQ